LRSMEQEQISAGKRIESEARRIGNILTDFRRSALTTASLFLGGMGIQQFTNYISNLDAGASRLGRSMNMSARDVLIWQGALKQVGGTAEEANTSLATLSEDMNRFDITGQSSMLGVLSQLGIDLYDSNRQLKTAGQLWIDLSQAVQGKDAAQATSLLRQIPGATQAMINLILLGPGRLREILEVQKQLASATKETTEQAEKYREELSKLDTAATNLGRSVFNIIAPAITGLIEKWNEGVIALSDTPERRKKRLERLDSEHGLTTTQETRARFGEPPEWMKRIERWFGKDPDAGPFPEPPKPVENTGAGSGVSRSRVPSLTPVGPSLTPSPEVIEKSIRDKFSARGIDPDIAVRVAKSEGLFAYKYSPTGQSFIPGEQSFGPFQLNYSPKGTSLGDRFTRETGLDARNPATVDKQIDFVAEWVRKHGWGDFHGWKGDRFAGINREGAAPNATTVNIGTLNVNGAQVKDAQTFGDTVGPALKRSVTAGAANTPF
jgi:hypothetical protein